MARASRRSKECGICLATAMGLASCTRSSQSTSPAPSASASSATTTTASAAGATRMQLRVDRCLPVGYGLACGADVVVDGSTSQPAHIEACIGSNDVAVTDFHTRLSQAPIVGNDAGAPIAFWVDAVPAPESARYCGVIVIHASAHWRVVAVQP